MSSAKTKWRTQSVETILVRGNYAEGNFGDDALAIAAHQLLGPHAARIVSDSYIAYADNRLVKFQQRNLDEERFTAIVYGGGTQFFSFEPDPPTARLPLSERVQRKLTKPLNLIDSYRARRKFWIESRTPRLYIGSGVGPFPEGSSAEESTAKILKDMAMVWVRDDASMTFCERHGIDTAFRSADLCFTPSFAKAVCQPQSAVERPGMSPAIGIILRDWAGWSDVYYATVIEAARRLREQGIKTTFFSMAPSDARFLGALERIGEPVNAWDCSEGAFEAFWGDLARMDLIVTSRFHGAVFATLSETPFLAINIEPKLEMIQNWASTGKSPEMIMPATTDPNLITRHVLKALGEIKRRRETTRAMLREQRRLAAIGERHLAAYFEQRTQR